MMSYNIQLLSLFLFLVFVNSLFLFTISTSLNLFNNNNNNNNILKYILLNILIDDLYKPLVFDF